MRGRSGARWRGWPVAEHLWLCRNCGRLVVAGRGPVQAEEAPEHPHRIEALAVWIGVILRGQGRAWRAMGWSADGQLWGVPCESLDAESERLGIPLAGREPTCGRDARGDYTVEPVPPMAWRGWQALGAAKSGELPQPKQLGLFGRT